MRRLLMRLTDRLPAREITRSNGAPYLERYYLGSLFGWTFYLHRFLAGDEVGYLHDHPWRLSWSLILAGRYRETRWLRRIDADGLHCRQRWFRTGWLNVVRGIDFHRIDLSKGGEVWTLFAHGRRIRRWGFLDWGSFPRSEGWVFHYRPFPARSPDELPWYETAHTGAQLRNHQLHREVYRSTYTGPCDRAE